MELAKSAGFDLGDYMKRQTIKGNEFVDNGDS